MIYMNSCPRCATGEVECTTGLRGVRFECLRCGWELNLPITSEHRLARAIGAWATAADRRLQSVAA